MSRKEDIRMIKKLKKQTDRDFREAMRELEPGRKRYWVTALAAAGMIAYCSMPGKEIKKVVPVEQKPITKNELPTVAKQAYEPVKKQIVIHKHVYEPVQPVREKVVIKRVYVPMKTENETSEPQPVPNNNEYFYFPVRGDTLSRIASAVTGSQSNWPAIQRYNNILNHIIEVNQPIRIPSHLVRNNTNLYYGALPGNMAYARKNDSLESIAHREMGSSSYADDIFRFNRQLNNRFSSTIYNKEYVFLPPKT